MATDKTTLNGRIAKEKKPSALELKTRVASAWTISRTMLPQAPSAVQLKFAKQLLQNSTPVLKHVLRQTAINAHHTRVAEAFKELHKCEINDLLEDPSLLNKERNAVQSELKGEAKNASDDRKESGPLPDEYPEPKRTEPEGLEASESEKRPEGTINMSEEVKVAKTKKACLSTCKGKGCVNCKKAAEEVSEAPAEEKPKEKPEGEASSEEHTDEPAPEESHEEDPSSEGVTPTEGEEHKEEETFDPEKEDVLDAIEDVKSDIEHLEDVINDEQDGGDADGTNSIDDFLSDETGEELTEEGQGDEMFGDEEALDGEETAEQGHDELAEGEETLDLAGLFDQENLDGKVSSLANEDVVEAGLDDGDDDFFSFNPSQAAELESVLDQEEEISSPADMFAVDSVADPMASILASRKQAAEEGVVEPGELADYFETDIKGTDDRDFETDHDGDLLAEVADSFKQPTRSETRDQTSILKDPKTASKPASQQKKAGIRTLNPSMNPVTPRQRQASSTDLAKLLLGDD